MIDVLRNIYSLLKTGRLDYINSRDHGIKDIFAILGVYVIAIVTSLFLITIVFQTFYLEFPRNNTLIILKQKDPVHIFTIGIIISPLLEEIRHRLCLRYSSLNFSIMIASWIHFVVGFIVNENTAGRQESFFVFKIALASIIGVIIYSYLSIDILNNSKLSNLWSKYPRGIYYLFLFSFVLLHINNFADKFEFLILGPLITLPQIVSGIMFSYCRLKYGIVFSILFHSTNNLFFTILDMYGQ